jgi:hypothetical protein
VFIIAFSLTLCTSPPPVRQKGEHPFATESEHILNSIFFDNKASFFNIQIFETAFIANQTFRSIFDWPSGIMG